MSMRDDRRTDDSGFTLIELAVSMMVMGVLLAVVGTTVAGSKRSADNCRTLEQSPA